MTEPTPQPPPQTPPQPAPAPATPSPAPKKSLLDRRAKIALGLAAFEGLLLLLGNLSRWVVIVIAIPCIGFYLWRGREMKPGIARDFLWIIAVAQALVILAAIVAFFIGTLVLIVLGVFVGIALLLLYLDEPGKR
jgi:cation transport ATPase